jgi:hypothetical protein
MTGLSTLLVPTHGGDRLSAKDGRSTLDNVWREPQVKESRQQTGPASHS